MSVSGRPRSFDREAALRLALRAFWEHGFDTTSVAQLTSSMGIAPPSFYAAFGDKRRLFDEAADTYLSDLQAGLDAYLEAPTANEAIESLLQDTARYYTAADSPAGCFVMSDPQLTAQRAAIRSRIIERIRQGQQDGELDADVDVEALGEYVETVMVGMSAKARDGAGLEQLLGVVDRAMSAWPASRRRAGTSP